VGVYRWLLRSFGWIQTFKITDYLTILAAFVGILSLSVGTQVFSRIVFGLVTGINTILIPTYLTSVLPGSMGGPAGTLNQLFITIGIFFGFWMGYLVVGEESSEMGWRFIIGLPILPALIRLHTAQNVFPYLPPHADMKASRA
jgi:MFS family permease